MKKRYFSTVTTWFLTLCLVFLLGGALSYGVQDEDKTGFRAVKIDTGYWVIEARISFNAKAINVAFNHPNTGTKKIEAGQQVMGINIAIYNPSDKDIKVRRNDFLINDAVINHFIVQEKTTQPLVVTVATGEAIGITNYYIMDAGLQDIKSLKVVYSSVDKTLKKIQIGIPLIQEKTE